MTRPGDLARNAAGPGGWLCWLLSISVPHSSAHESCSDAFSLPSKYEIGGMKVSCSTIFFLISLAPEATFHVGVRFRVDVTWRVCQVFPPRYEARVLRFLLICACQFKYTDCGLISPVFGNQKSTQKSTQTLLGTRYPLVGAQR